MTNLKCIIIHFQTVCVNECSEVKAHKFVRSLKLICFGMDFSDHKRLSLRKEAVSDDKILKESII